MRENPKQILYHIKIIKKTKKTTKFERNEVENRHMKTQETCGLKKKQSKKRALKFTRFEMRPRNPHNPLKQAQKKTTERVFLVFLG